MPARVWNLQSQLLVAIQTNDETKVRYLVENDGLDPDCTFTIGGQVRPAICLSVQRANLQLTKYLVKKGCSVNQRDSLGHSPLHIACANCYQPMVEFLIGNRANVNAVTPQGQTPLHLASKTDSLEIVRMLCEAGGKVDEFDHERKTPLLNSCIQGHFPVADYLIKRGADVNSCSPCGNSPLLFAATAHQPNASLLSRLLSAGATLNHQNLEGESALHAVVRGGPTKQRSEALILLLSQPNCALNLRTKLGHTPLHLAALQHDQLSMTVLLRAGCDIGVKDKLGLTPLFYSLREGDQHLVKLLIAAGAKLNQEQHWLDDRRLIACVKNPSLLQWLQDVSKQCPKLTEICRSALRMQNCGGKRTYNEIPLLALPQTLKQFLLFELI